MKQPVLTSARPLRIMLVYGTRPEAVKMAPLVLALRAADGFAPHVVVTGQHREMLDQVNAVFGITPHVDLDIHEPGQTLTDVTTKTLRGVGEAIGSERPDAVIVQGDTTTSFAASLAAFYEQVPVIHAEAGLRTDDIYSPFPEEMNRRITTRLASLHLAPTLGSRMNLLAEGISEDRIAVTGNTVIDALKWTVSREADLMQDPTMQEVLTRGLPYVLVTAHRRESWGEPMKQIGRALARIARAHPDHAVVFPAHRNPRVREAIFPLIAGADNVVVTESVPYGVFCHLMARATLILTDSGGVQEEGPSLGKPVLVMRTNTERPEAVAAGTVRLIGTDEDRIVDAVDELLTDPEAYTRMANAVNPYGDGFAAERTLAAIAHFFCRGPRPDEFDPAALPSDRSIAPRPLPTTH